MNEPIPLLGEFRSSLNERKMHRDASKNAMKRVLKDIVKGKNQHLLNKWKAEHLVKVKEKPKKCKREDHSLNILRELLHRKENGFDFSVLE